MGRFYNNLKVILKAITAFKPKLKSVLAKKISFPQPNYMAIVSISSTKK